MNIEELFDRYESGEDVAAPEALGAEFDKVKKGFDAIRRAVGETLIDEPDVAPDRRPPALPEDYQIIGELGRGGMGVVYLVYQKSLNRKIALKVLRPGEIRYVALVGRFLEEARHLAQVRHPNIVSIHEIGNAAGEPFFTMDYVEGEPLSETLMNGPLTPSMATAILKQVCEGVAHAHERGIIHRDLKPANILLDRERRAFVTDFGLAREVSRESALTQSGEILGTPAYMAPEQARGQKERIGEATDVHALGAILYVSLTGRTPYGNGSAADIIMKLLQDAPAAPRTINHRIPRDLETICLKALQKDPERRYVTVRALLEDLARFESGEPIRARAPSAAERFVRLGRKHWKLASAASVVAIVSLILGSFLLDRTPARLVGLGDAAAARGEYLLSVRYYREAAGSASGAAAKEIINKMAKACARMDGDLEGIATRALLAQVDRDAEFGEHNYFVVLALASGVLANAGKYFLEGSPSLAFESDRDLAVYRIGILLNRTESTGARRAVLERTLAMLTAQPKRFEPVPVDTAPSSDSAVAANTGDPPVAFLLDDKNRDMNKHAGLIKLRIEQAPIRRGIDVPARLRFYDAAGVERGSVLLHFGSDPSEVEIAVADGDYQLRIAPGDGNVTTTYLGSHRYLNRLRAELSSVPFPVAVEGNVITLPAIAPRVVDEITFSSPRAGDLFDLRDSSLQWSAVAGAAKYELRLSYQTEIQYVDTGEIRMAGAGYREIGPIIINAPFLRLGSPDLDTTISPDLLERIRAEYIPGLTIECTIEAFDATGRVAGMTSEPHKFIIKRGV